MVDKKRLNRFWLSLILILAAFFRLYGINWDQGHHLHPDERMIIMVTEKVHLSKPLTLQSILTPESSLNPRFFAYGSLPIYLLKTAGNLLSFLNPIWAHYQGLLYVGRFLSVLFDLGTIIIIFKISKFLLPKRYRLLPAFFYSLSVLAVQTSHFYVVDVPLTFFTTLTLYLLIKLVSKPSLNQAVFVGIAFGLAAACKVSSILLIVPVLVAMMLIIFKKGYTFQVTCYTFLIFTFLFLIFNLTMPYALLDFPTFKAHTIEQSRMTKDAFVFPYTLQYVGTTPYIYHLKNMILWGMGVPLGVISIMGTIFVSLFVLKILFQWLYCYIAKNLKPKTQNLGILMILLSFFWVYFLVTGSFAVKFMRYWLPIYPLFCIFGGLFISRLVTWCCDKSSKLKVKSLKLQFKVKNFFSFLFVFLIFNFSFLIFLWPLSFLSIYSRPNTRVAASEWINENIGQGATLSVEHWDDRVPMWGDFNFLEMPMYEPDQSEQKWKKVSANLEKTDYLIIASNRLYVPLMKLTDCQKLPSHRCYPKTLKYYQKLFDGSLGFTKVAEFSSYPKLPHCYLVTLLPCYLNDSSADESFTVYDHPKIMIFKKDKD